MTYKLLSKHTGQPVAQIREDTDRYNFMSSEEAKAYGLIDEIHAEKEDLLAS